MTFTTISPYMSLYSSLMLCCENFYIHQTYFEKPFLPIFFNQLTNGNFGSLWYSRFRLNSNNLRYCRRESQCNLSNFSSQMMMINIQKAKINLTREISKKASVIRTQSYEVTHQIFKPNDYGKLDACLRSKLMWHAKFPLRRALFVREVMNQHEAWFSAWNISDPWFFSFISWKS